MHEQKICQLCGELIPPARLQILPKTNTCAPCAIESNEVQRVQHVYLPQIFTKADEEAKNRNAKKTKADQQLAFNFNPTEPTEGIRDRFGYEVGEGRKKTEPAPITRSSRDRPIGVSFGPCPKCGNATMLKESSRDFSTYITCVCYPKCKWRA
jgi:hypothetical protein